MVQTLDLSQHPCFNGENRHKFMRIHLPVAPRCNVQCNFCTRRFDCVNESRPGVTQAVLTPEQAVWYLEQMTAAHPQIAVVGIAGPGDPFANPEETMDTLRRVRARFPQLLLCLATNGLQLLPYIPELGKLQVSHVSITVNAVDVKILEKIYAYVRYGKRVLTGAEGVAQLLENQLAAIPLLKAQGIVVKINTVVIQGINDEHVLEVARKVKELGADLVNPMPMYPNSEAAFGIAQVPSLERVREIKAHLANILPVMHHCTRCRADAVGFLGQAESESDQQVLQAAAQKPVGLPAAPAGALERQYVAVATREGLLVNQHLGEANTLWVYGSNGLGLQLIEKRPTPAAGGGDERWQQLGQSLRDCTTLLVSGVGPRPLSILTASGVKVNLMEGMIEEIVKKILAGESVCQYLIGPKRCGEACNGTGNGCG
ncbi:MAG: radical SAM protein [Candidatus Firestonebacteria bacterium]|nr:radical SAM protein [Candidatus Firestonebacteria bacterium]